MTKGWHPPRDVEQKSHGPGPQDGSRFLTHPVMRAALARHGMTPEETMDTADWRRHVETRHRTFAILEKDAGPQIVVTYGDARISWQVNGQGQPAVDFHIEDISDRRRTRVQLRIPLPATVTAALEGRRLGEIVGIEGAEDRIMETIHRWDVLTIDLDFIPVAGWDGEPTSAQQ